MKRMVAVLVLISTIASAQAGWYTILGWDDATCITSPGPMLDGPLAESIEHKLTEDDGVVVTDWISSGKIGGVYFLGAAACARFGAKYQRLWAQD